VTDKKRGFVVRHMQLDYLTGGGGQKNRFGLASDGGSKNFRFLNFSVF
jgi:hypothetical protein